MAKARTKDGVAWRELNGEGGEAALRKAGAGCSGAWSALGRALRLCSGARDEGEGDSEG